MEKVGLLGVIDDAFTFCVNQNGGPTYNEMRQARATVAEVIEQRAELLKALRRAVTRQGFSNDELIAARAALARIGGAA